MSWDGKNLVLFWICPYNTVALLSEGSQSATLFANEVPNHYLVGNWDSVDAGLFSS